MGCTCSSCFKVTYESVCVYLHVYFAIHFVLVISMFVCLSIEGEVFFKGCCGVQIWENKFMLQNISTVVRVDPQFGPWWFDPNKTSLNDRLLQMR